MTGLPGLRCPTQPPPAKLPPLFTAASPPRSPALLPIKETRNQTEEGVILYGMAFWHANGSSWGQYMGFRKVKVATTNGRRTKSCCFRQVPSDAKHQMSKMSTSQPGREQHGPWHQQVKYRLQETITDGPESWAPNSSQTAPPVPLCNCADDSPALHSIT